MSRKSNVLTARKLFAANLRKFRTDQSLSQEKLAELAGLHRTYIGAVERAERNISIDNIERIARALNKTINDFFCTKGQ
ncbi:MAG: transcriptional regulator [Deltaproteobacteria bacterium GWA2_45_12]|nr:MAG: transcriptional regulator [Deltaproteobacteria bacterium GWA2_45_12]